MQNQHIERQFLDLSAVELFTGISRRTWQTWIQRGLIRAYRPGTKILLNRNEIVDFICESQYTHERTTADQDLTVTNAPSIAKGTI